MKNFLLLLLSAVCFSFHAQSKDLSGTNWREISRVNHEGEEIRFKDTIFIHFLEGNEYTWQKRKDFMHRGSYKYNGKVIDMTTKFFTVVKHTDKRLVLRDKHATYEFEAYTPAPHTKLPAEKKPATVNDIEEIAGKWNVFKRTSATTLKSIDYAHLVENVVVEKRDTSWGVITSSSKPHEADGWKIIKLKDGVLYAEGKTSRRFEVSKRDSELILKEENITYFLKQFQE